MPDVRPSSDLRNHYADVSREVREGRSPVIITVNGRGDTVLMGLADYERLMGRLEVLEMLSEAEEDVRDGRVAPLQGTLDSLRAELAATAVASAKA